MLKKLVMLVVAIGLTVPVIVYGQKTIIRRKLAVKPVPKYKIVETTAVFKPPVVAARLCPLEGCKRLNLKFYIYPSLYSVEGPIRVEDITGQACSTYDLLLELFSDRGFAWDFCHAQTLNDAFNACFIDWTCAEKCTVPSR